MTFEGWWIKTYHRRPTHGPCCTCQDCGQFYENDCRCDCKDVAEAAWQAAIEKAVEIVRLDTMFTGEYCEHGDRIIEKMKSAR